VNAVMTYVWGGCVRALTCRYLSILSIEQNTVAGKMYRLPEQYGLTASWLINGEVSGE